MKIKSIFGSKFKSIELGDVVRLAKDKPLDLRCGRQISDFNIAFQTYGKLNKNKDNVILICHALTGDQYVASANPVTQKEGWWSSIVGDGKAIDTKKYFVICSNVLGGCLGSLGPKEIDEKTGQPYGFNFPIITVGDMVEAQKLLLDELGIDKIKSVIGGSMGGFLALQWSISYPNMVASVMPIATSYRFNTQNIAFNEISRQAIMADVNWCEGKYYEEKKYPKNGLALARMIAHITYMSKDALHQKFGRNLQNSKDLGYNFDIDFQIESYLHHQGYSFVERFDPNSYLYITKAMDYFDLEEEFGGNLSAAFSGCDDVRFCLVSFSDDWLFTCDEAKYLAKSLNIAGADVSFVNIESKNGHDSFLLENKPLGKTIKGFLDSL